MDAAELDELCRAALGAVVVAATLMESALALGVGALFGFSAPIPLAHLLGFATCLIVVNLVVLAVHIVLAAKIENQLVGLGIGLIGTLIATFAVGWPAVYAHLTPWGYYALSAPAEYQGHDLVQIQPSYPSVAALAVVAAVLFAAITARFDRQEA